MSLKDFVVDGPMLSLESQLDCIALESGITANLLETFKRVLPNFAQRLKDVNAHLFDSSKSQDEIVIKLSRKQKAVLEMVPHVDFLNFGERLVSVPENFKGNVLQYALTLNGIVSEVYQLHNTILAEYNGILSSFITNKDDKFSLKDHSAFFARIKKERDGFTKRLMEFTNPKAGVSKAKFKSIMYRMSDMDPLVREVAKLTQQHSRTKLTEIQNAVNHSTDLLDIVITGVQDGTITHISPNATLNISKGAYEVAKYVELVGVVYFDVTVLLNTVDNMMTAVLELNTQ